MSNAIILDTPKQIEFARLFTLRAMVKLEIKGLKRSKGPSACAMLKKEFGFKGNKESILAQLTKMIEAEQI